MQNYMARIYTASGKEFTNPKFTSIFPKRIISGSLLRWKTASYCGDKTVFSTVCRRVFYLLKTKQDYFHHDIYLILDSRSNWVQWKLLLTSVKEFQKSQRQITPTPTPTPGKKYLWVADFISLNCRLKLFTVFHMSIKRTCSLAK